GVSLSIMNDAAFIIDFNLNIYEHQSTYNPNMPLRSLLYFTDILKKYVDKKNIYGKTLVRIPTPRFVVFYNGLDDARESYELRLSDAFAHQVDEPQIELVCQVLNINKGKNQEVINYCKFLEDYMILVDYVRYYQQEGMELSDAVRMAIDRCISENVLREFLENNRNEVEKTMVLDYTFEKQIEMTRQEAWEDGNAKGRAEGLSQGLTQGKAEGKAEGMLITYFKLVREGFVTIEKAAQDTGLSVEEIQKRMDES
ncbi:MAG: hypothetical protein HUJ70_13825, partial [Pseudobutyrivibrio sp.]|nr:hypothetical protein [Pseudobutyrivibrio sp.]